MCTERKQYYHLFIDDFFNASVKDQRYCEALVNGSLVFNDGIGIKIGGLLKGLRFRENMKNC